MVGKLYRDILPLCACGCGKKVNKFASKYLRGHNNKSNKERIVKQRGRTHSDAARRAIIAEQTIRQYRRIVQLIRRKAEQY